MNGEKQQNNSRIRRRVQKVRTRVRLNQRKFKKISRSATLGGLFLSFLKIGLIGFGGGLAVIAQIRTLVVSKRKWLSEQEFVEAFALAQSLPGTSAGNAVTYIGLKMCGWRGASLAMIGFILPSTLLMIALAALYSQFRALPDTERLFHGLNSAVVALILATAWRLGKNTLNKSWQWWLAIAALFLIVFLKTTVVEVVLLAGLIGIYFNAYGERRLERLKDLRQSFVAPRRNEIRQRIAARRKRRARRTNEQQHNFIGGYLTRALADERVRLKQQNSSAENNSSASPEENAHSTNTKATNNRLYSFVSLAGLPFVIANFGLLISLAIVFLRMGAVTFGGGFVMIPLIESEVVENHQWLTHQEFADATALGQITPGPVLVTATFIGYRVAGIAGALVATVSIFLPAFLLTVVAGSSLKRFRSNKFIQSFLLGVTPAVVGLLVAAAISVARAGIHTSVGVSIAILAVFVLLKFRPNPFWVLLGAGVIRFLVGLFLW